MNRAWLISSKVLMKPGRGENPLLYSLNLSGRLYVDLWIRLWMRMVGGAGIEPATTAV